ncbi:MAG: alpha/beta hydrolase [Erysipelotrichaceae bacterium]|nr:alpha/beta hydrolase [Erysipelotrichaceae bacterium]
MSTLVKEVQFSNKTMEYIEFGKEDGAVFVILPGLSLKSVMGAAEGIVNAYQLLAQEYHMFLFDHIKKEPEGYTAEDMAEDTLCAMDSLGLRDITLMGVSMGGMVSQLVTLKDPKRIQRLILCSTTSTMKHADPELFGRWRSLAGERNLPKLMEAFGEAVYTPSFYEQYKEIILASGNGTTEQDYHNFLVSLNAMKDFDVTERLTEIKCPILVLGAGEDRVLGVERSKEIMEKTGCAGYIYEGYGHGVYDEAPDYLSRIKEFLDSLQ